MTPHRSLSRAALAAAGLALAVAGCSGSADRSAGNVSWQSLTGESGEAPVKPALEVNAFLWRASLETLDFLPIRQANPNAGVISTDWHAEPADSDERFRADIHIRTTELRADGVKVELFRQARGEDGDWQDAEVAEETRRGLEDAIIAQARDLRLRQRDQASRSE